MIQQPVVLSGALKTKSAMSAQEVVQALNSLKVNAFIISVKLHKITLIISKKKGFYTNFPN